MSDKDNGVQISSVNQSGGITAHTVNVNLTPEPKISADALFMNKPDGSEYRSRVAIKVESPYPPSNLFIAVHAPSIKGINLIPQRSGLTMMGHCGDRPGFSFANLQSPFGVIHLDIVTSKPEEPKIEWDLT